MASKSRAFLADEDLRLVEFQDRRSHGVARQERRVVHKIKESQVPTFQEEAIRKVFKDAEIVAQHGPVRVIMKDGKLVDE